jgi:hypothetical protein
MLNQFGAALDATPTVFGPLGRLNSLNFKLVSEEDIYRGLHIATMIFPKRKLATSTPQNIISHK